MFTWGFNEFGRLGHNYDAEMRGPVYRVHSQVRTPTEITSLQNEVVVDIGCGGWSTWALTSRGKVYGCGKVHRFESLISA
jgi:alpha-tubulin suppressor-like RCC1 family protein